MKLANPGRKDTRRSQFQRGQMFLQGDSHNLRNSTQLVCGPQTSSNIPSSGSAVPPVCSVRRWETDWMGTTALSCTSAVRRTSGTKRARARRWADTQCSGSGQRGKGSGRHYGRAKEGFAHMGEEARGSGEHWDRP